MTKTIDISSPTIRALRAEAAEAGDTAMAAICDGALRGDLECLEECQSVLARAACSEAVEAAEGEENSAAMAAFDASEEERQARWWAAQDD